jgi:hypothetical protein
MRHCLLASAAVAALVIAAPPAAACTLSALTLTCAAPGTFPQQSSALDNLTVVVEAGATVENTAANTPALRLSGNTTAVKNAGTIRNPNTNNNNANNAIQGTGTGLAVTNHGLIESGDRGIHITGGSGGFSLENHGTIRSRRQAVRTENALLLPGSRVENWGTIESQTDRAVQLRGRGSTVINHGTLIGGDEVIEARDDFLLTNTGTIRARDGAVDADGAQFASGRVFNFGLIEGTDDGLDMDEGEVFNAATGVIRSRDLPTGEGNGIDIDEVFDNGVTADLRPSGPVTILNEGLIEGPRAIGSDPAATNSVTIRNSGTLRGTSGTAVALAPGQTGVLWLTQAGVIDGDVRFAGGDDTVHFSDLRPGAGIMGLFDGGAGTDTVHFEYLIGDVVSLTQVGDLIALALDIRADTLFAASFRNFEFWSFSDTDPLTTEALVARFAQPGPVPLPAALPMLLAALGGIALLRRRRA